jgi:2-keto-4-pentenoate hydratase
MMKALNCVGFWLWIALCSGVTAQELAPAAAARLAGQFEASAFAPDVLSGADLITAEQVQDAYVLRLMPLMGGVVGYKAGLTSLVAQQRFSVDHPLLGLLLHDMLLPSPARISLQSGARLLVEADLLVRVADVSINHARDWVGMLRAIDVVIPFIEVPDLLYAPHVQITAPLLQAANVGARWGVLGTPIPLRAGEDWHRRLAEFQVSLAFSQGEPITGRGRDLLGHPLAIVEWLRDAVQARGRQLSPGDLLSMGSLTSLRPTQLGSLRAVYTGLDPAGPVTVELEFISGAMASPVSQ